MTAFPTNKTEATAQKRRGGYYTPIALADYLVRWAIRSGDERILEPSCGDGNFIEAALKRIGEVKRNTNVGPAQICVTEIDAGELKKAQSRARNCGAERADISWRCGDFFELYADLLAEERYDVVVGNPPFIRFQYFAAASRDTAFGHLRAAGYRPTKLANAWAAFVQLSVELLKKGGRLAMVLPAELLQVGYAGQLRDRITAVFDHVVLVGFDELVFPEIQQEVVLLLAEGKRTSTDRVSDIHTLQLRNGKALLELWSLGETVRHLPVKHSRKSMKWTSLFLTSEAFDALDSVERLKGIKKLGDYAQVDVGVVTGRNSFFVMDTEQVEKLKVNGSMVSVVGRTSALKSIIFSNEDLRECAIRFPSWLLNLKGVEKADISPELLEYIRAGEEKKVHEGYKCRIRPRWFDVPSVYAPDAFLFRQIHKAPFLVANRANAVSTDTIHRVRVYAGIDIDVLCAASINSLTFAWAEVCGRSYGGGVLELEPREAEELPIPYENADALDIEKVDHHLRAQQLDIALDYTDSVLLRDGLGFDKAMIKYIRAAWSELRDRRRNRRYSGTA